MHIHYAISEIDVVLVVVLRWLVISADFRVHIMKSVDTCISQTNAVMADSISTS